MIIPRLASTALRFAQFLCAAIVLGLTSYFLQQNHKYDLGPFGRLFYSVVIAAVSVVVALLWMLPTTHHIVNYMTDLFFCGAWFAVFGLLQDWFEDQMHCGSSWQWDHMGLHDNLCGQWNAAQAFSFLSAVFWFASFVLGILVWKRASAPVATTAGPAPVTTGRKRWFGRSRV
ncbi:hypothetical protein EJ02DRAFT_512340 [Clathrospora elynae]|uniref:MARVEL domain-containing protein n=1 Tax=Clathrospora elynae TaxID=706981 RepID=A0A6A5SP21_9PLEO|nr:hypothetical protein EJ02DRAFT_512340 [Clathrospora elynae]